MSDRHDDPGGERRPRRARAKKVALTQRDLAVMEELVLRRAETIGHLHELFYTGLSRKRAVNRLAELVGAGYLHKVRSMPFGSDMPVAVYTLGPRAKAALELRSLASEHFRYRRWNPTLRDSSIPHQLVVNRVVALLNTRAVPEQLLPVAERGGAKHRPDALLACVPRYPSDEARYVALEVDLGHYSRERILGKLAGFSAIAEARHLLIVVPDDARRDQVRRWVRGGLGSGKASEAVTVRTTEEVHAFHDPMLFEHVRFYEPFLPLDLVPEDDARFGFATYGGSGAR